MNLFKGKLKKINNTPSKLANYTIVIKTKTWQSVELIITPWGLFPTKLKATANELGQRKTQLRCYEDILLPENYHKFCLTKI